MGILDDAIREHLELKRRHGVPEEELERQEEEALGPARRDVAQQPEDAELAAGATVADETDGTGEAVESAIAEAEHEPAAADQETALFDMEQDAAEAEVEPEASLPGPEQTAVHEVPEAAEPVPAEPTAVEPPPVEPEPVAAEPTAVEPPPVEAEPVGPAAAEPTPVEPPPVEPPPVEDEAPVEPAHKPDRADRIEETQPHGVEAAGDPFEDDPELAEELELAEEGELAEDEEGEDPLTGDPEDDELDVLEDTPDFLQETPEHDRLWFEQKPPRDFDFD